MTSTHTFEQETTAGLVIANTYRLRELRWTQPTPGFVADRVDGGDPVLLRLWPDAADGNPLVSRHLEATFLRHPNLLPCLGSGLVELETGSHVWAAYALPEMLLSEAVQPIRPMMLRSIAQDVIRGLTALHELGIVFGALDLNAVALYEGRWVLADYSQLRLCGSEFARETRRLLGVLAAAPPEAYFGQVSSAWDVWGLARLCQLALIGNGEIRRPERQAQVLPEPFDSIVSEGLISDPTGRIGLPEIEEMLRPVPSAASHPVEQRPQSRLEPEGFPAPGPDNREPLYRDASAPTRFQSSGLPGWRVLLYALVGLGLLGLIVASAWRSSTPQNGTHRGVGSMTAAAANARNDGPEASAELAPKPFQAEQETATDATPEKKPIVAPADKPSDAGPTTDPREQVRQTVERWAGTLRSANLVGHVGLYAARLERYLGETNVPQSRVYQTKSDLLRHSQYEQLVITNPRIQMHGPDRASVSFEKKWKLAGGAQSGSGSAHSEMELERTGQGWRIVSETESQM